MPEARRGLFARFAAPAAADTPRVYTCGRSSLTIHRGVRHLRLDEADDYHTGWASGHLLAASGDAIVRLLRLAPTGWLALLVCRIIRPHLERVQVPQSARDEIRGIADATGIALHTLFYVNFVFDVLKRYGFHCSTLIFFQDDTVLVGRNTDLLPALAEVALKLIPPLVVEVSIPGRARFTHVAAPCLVGVINGCNEHGISVHSHQIINVAEDPQGPRLASSLLMRMQLEGAHDLASAAEIARANPTMRSLNVVVASVREQRGMVLEVHPDRVHRAEREGAFACTTHFTSKAMRPLHDGPIVPSEMRLASLQALITEYPRPDIACMITMLQDSRNGLQHQLSGCSLSNNGTFQSFVIDVARGLIVVSNGRQRPVSTSGVPVVLQVGGRHTGAQAAPPPDEALPEPEAAWVT